jgi:hypothetical protein
MSIKYVACPIVYRLNYCFSIHALNVLFLSDYYCPQGSISATPCPKGQYAALGQATCFANCEAGKYSNTSASVLACIPCQDGYSCAGGSSAPIVCSAGTYCVTGSTTGAVPCVAGSFNPASLQSACQNCSVGAYCPLGSLVASSCPVGTFNGLLGKTGPSDCLLCPLINTTSSATYCAAGSAVSTTPCPAGSYCPTPADLIRCPQGFVISISYCNCAVCCNFVIYLFFLF